MKKIIILAAVLSMLASCSKDLTIDTGAGTGANAGLNYDAIMLKASIADDTKVIVTGDATAKTSTMEWEAGDEVSLVTEGKVYTYRTTEGGQVGTFVAVGDAPASITDATAVYYNATAKEDLSATFDISDIQVEGELSSKLPLGCYIKNPVVKDNMIEIDMKPLASIIEFSVATSKDWSADALSFGASAHVVPEGYLAATGVTVSPVDGALVVDSTSAKKSNSIRVDFPSTRNITDSEPLRVKMVVGNVKFQTKFESSEAFSGGAVLSLYKNVDAQAYNLAEYGAETYSINPTKVLRENFRRSIWQTKEKVEAASLLEGNAHIYQPISDIMAGHKDGISNVEDLLAFADEVNKSGELYGIGSHFCNVNGEVLLNDNLDLTGVEWTPIGQNGSKTASTSFSGVFLGQNHTISNLNIVHEAESFPNEYINETTGEITKIYNNQCGLFGAIANKAVVKDLTVKGTILENRAVTEEWNYAGGIVGYTAGGQIINCTSYVDISAGALSAAKLRVGGITGDMRPIGASIAVVDCENYGIINLSHTEQRDQYNVVGGIVGFWGDGADATISTLVANCNNYANITNVNSHANTSNGSSSTQVGGIVGYISSVNMKGLIIGCENSGNISVSSKPAKTGYIHVGGIVGFQYYHSIIDCINKGNVIVPETGSDVTVGYNIAGIAGLQAGNKDTTHVLKVKGCENQGNVSIPEETMTAACVAGIVGMGYYCQAEYTNCTNRGEIVGANHGAQIWVGGCFGKIGVSGEAMGDKSKVAFNCNNYGKVVMSAGSGYTGWNYVGGITGTFYGGTGNSAGLYGSWCDTCTNYGTVVVNKCPKVRAGGVSGSINRSMLINCVNEGVVDVARPITLAAEPAGGIVGFAENNDCKIGNCRNSGIVCVSVKSESTMASQLGGILGGGMGSTAKGIVGCTFNGKVLKAGDDKSNTKYVIGAIIGNAGSNAIVSECKVGGALGVLKAGTTTYETDECNNLVNDPESDYYWEKVIAGAGAIKATDNQFLSAE